MEYSALRLETLALHEVLKAGLPTDQLGPVNQRELAAWKWFKGYYRVVGVQVIYQICIKSNHRNKYMSVDRNVQINQYTSKQICPRCMLNRRMGRA